MVQVVEDPGQRCLGTQGATHALFGESLPALAAVLREE